MVFCVGGALCVGLSSDLAARDVATRAKGGDVPREAGGRTGALASDDYGAAAAGCDVTKPTKGGLIKEDGLRVAFGRKTTIVVTAPGEAGPPGTIFGTIWTDGSIRAKVLWRRDKSAFGRFRVKAIRRPGGDRLVRDTYDGHLGPESRVIPGVMFFPREGCWHVTGRSGSAKLRAVVWVVEIDAA